MTTDRDFDVPPARMSLTAIRHGFIGIPVPWRVPLLALLAALITVFALLHETVFAMVRTWAGSSSFGHGFVVVPLSLYLAWTRRRRLAALVPRPSWIGVCLILVCGVAWLLGDAASVAVVEQFALIGMLQAVVVALLGPAVAWELAFPLAFLFFAVPSGEAFLPWMQSLTAAMVVHVLNWVKVPVFLDGYYLMTPFAIFHVAEACAGLRYLVSSVVIGTLFADLTYRSLWRRGAFIILSVLVPLVANGVRASMIVLLAYYSNGAIATGVDHFIYGWVFLSIVTVLLLMAGMALREKNVAPAGARAAPVSRQPRSAARVMAVSAATLLAIAAVPTARHWSEPGEPPASVRLLAPSPASGSWREAPAGSLGWQPHIVGANAETARAFERDGRTVLLDIAYYARQRPGAEAVSSANRLSNASWTQVNEGRLRVRIDGTEHSVTASYLRRANRNVLVLQWYWVDGAFVGNAYLAKARQAAAALLGRNRAAALVTVAVEYGLYDPPPAAAVREFVQDLGPLATALGEAARGSM